MSISTTTIDISNINNYKEYFFVYGPDYHPWCLEIDCIAYPVNKLMPGWQDAKIEESQIDLLINDFINENHAMRDLFNEEERTQYRTNLKSYFTTQILDKTSTWKDLITEFLKYTNTWDIYALSVIYLYIIQDMELHTFSKIAEYRNKLKQIVVAMPGSRPIVDTIKKDIYEIFKTINKKEFHNIKELLTTNSKNIEHKNKIYKNLSKTNVSNIKQAAILKQ
jgi:hypothetical protein